MFNENSNVKANLLLNNNLTKNVIYTMFNLPKIYAKHIWCLTFTFEFLYSSYEIKVANKCIVYALNYVKCLVCLCAV